MRIGMVGGVPAPIGGGGLEVQIERTARALARRGHEVIRAECAGADARWDVLHAMGAEGGVQFVLHHWTRNHAPLVVSPVLVVAPGWQEHLTVATSRMPCMSGIARGRRRLLERADAVVAITEYERDVIRRITRGAVEAVIVPNGVDVPAPAEGSGMEEPGYLLLLGTVSARKRQAEVLKAAPAGSRIVVVGAFHGTPRERADWDSLVAREGISWLGEVHDQRVVARITADAAALVHLSRAEVQSLAVLEALTVGTPVVISDIPSHRELAARHPGWVALAADVNDVERARRTLRPGSSPPEVPTWDDVAAGLEAVYARVLP